MDIEYAVNNYDMLDGAMEVAVRVFEPNTEEIEKYHQRKQWEERARSGALVVATFNNSVVGFAVCYPKETCFHIWNVGVLPEYRGQKIWQTMYGMIEAKAKSDGFKTLTLNTFPAKFTNMYRFAINNGFVETNSETDPVSNETKVFLEKSL